MRRAAFLAALLAACAPPPAPLPVAAVEAPARPPADTSAPAPSAPPAPPPPDPCAELGRAHHEVVDGSPLAPLARQRGSTPPLIAPFFGKCLPTPHGHWAVVITEAREDPPADVACWAIVHVDAGGRTARAYPPALGYGDAARCRATFDDANLVYGNWSSVSFADPVLADLDGDGEPEIFVKRDGSHQNQDVGDADLVWTYRDGAVVPFPPLRNFGVTALRDVDGDGRLDAVTHGDLHTSGGHRCGLMSMERFPVVGPELLAHAHADGTFSFDDDTARAFAKKQCPRRPARIGGGKQIGCALLWGASEREISRSLGICSSPRPSERPEPFCPEWCEQEKGYVKAFAAKPPPLRLDR